MRERAAGIMFAVAAAVFFAITVHALVLNRSATAGVAGALSLTFIFLRQLPVLESFEVLTLKAKFTQRINQFDELLTYVRETATVSANMLYAQVAFQDRLGGFGWPKKREFALELDRHLRSLGVPPADIERMKRPVIELATLDLLRSFEAALETRFRKRHDAVQKELQQYRHDNRPVHGDDPQALELQQRLAAATFKGFDYRVDGPNVGLNDVRAIVEAQLGQIQLEPEERAVLDTIATEVISLAEDCWRTQEVTEEAVAYLSEGGRRSPRERAERAFREAGVT